jgi:hypothetical protein
MTIRERVRSAIPRIVDALALVAMALRAPTAPLARISSCEYPMNTPLRGADDPLTTR